MKIVDANVVLRYLLADVPALFTRSEQILEIEPVYLHYEILAEVVSTIFFNFPVHISRILKIRIPVSLLEDDRFS